MDLFGTVPCVLCLLCHSADQLPRVGFSTSVALWPLWLEHPTNWPLASTRSGTAFASFEEDVSPCAQAWGCCELVLALVHTLLLPQLQTY